MSDERRRGNWMQSYTGVQVFPLDPRIEDFRIEDIAHALACQNRFAGHTREPYSVGEHSVRASLAVDVSTCRTDDQRRKVRLAALMHDAMAAYLVERASAGDRTPVLALTAGWATTRGTQYTAARARAAGLRVEACECPSELGPEGWLEVSGA